MVEKHRLVVAVECRFGGLASTAAALLDTGAEWSVVGGGPAEVLQREGDDVGHEVILTTRLGQARGSVYRIPVTLLAEDGSDLQVESSVILAPTWPGPPVLGYRGFLERIRIALEPGSTPDDDPWLFFGSDSSATSP